MKRIIYCFLFLILLMSFIACHPALRIYYGISDPKVETKTSLAKYMHRKGISNDNILVAANAEAFFPIFKLNSGVPDLRVFNKQGQLVIFKDTSSSCNAPGFDFTEKICGGKYLSIDTTKHLKDELPLYRKFSDGSMVEEESPYPDYTVFIFWGKFIGRLNKNHVNIWERNLAQSRNCRVRVLKVNVDNIKGINAE